MSEYIIGLTGGVASGKSVVAHAFRDLGVTLVDADIAARDAVAPGTDGLAEVVAAFGAGVLDTHGALDRVAMRQRVFTDADARRRLEAIVHPRVRWALQAASAAASGCYVVVAIPLLAEGGGRDGYPWLDRILVVDTPVATQLARLSQRDGIDAALAQGMVAAQASRRDRLAIADDILVNDGEIAALDEPIRELDHQYRLLASGSDRPL
jgi:dephospho-CoA kinase